MAKNLILICGDEEYLRDSKKKEILSKLGGGSGINFNAFDADNLDLFEVRQLIETPPFMEPFRRILIKGTGLFSARPPSYAGDTDLTALFSDIPESTFIIFDEAEADARTRLYKKVKKQGEVYKFESAAKLKGRERWDAEYIVRDMARRSIRESGKNIDERTLNYLLELTGFDMRHLSLELEKLICFTALRPEGADITRGDIDIIISRTLKDRIFYMADELLKGHTAEALSALEELFSLKTGPMRVIYLLARQFDQAYFTLDCIKEGMSDAEIEAATGLKNWQLKKLKEQLRGVTSEALRKKLEDILDKEEMIKQGRMDGRLAAELLIID